MGDALQNWLHLFFGSKNEVAVINDKVKCPSGGTISRARPKVDVGLDLELVEDLLFFLHHILLGLAQHRLWVFPRHLLCHVH